MHQPLDQLHEQKKRDHHHYTRIITPKCVTSGVAHFRSVDTRRRKTSLWEEP